MHVLKGFLAVMLLTLAGCQPGSETLALSSGKTLPGQSLRGQWVFINYWAEWCKPCVAEIPEFNVFSRQQNAGVRVLGVNYDGIAGADLRDQIQRMKIGFDVFNADPAVQLGYPRPQVLPTTYILDPQGNVARVLLGPQTLEGLADTLTELQSSVEQAASDKR